ncbi:hypothetical protein V6Z12_A01G170100 [Gossypium hirsutum]
MQPPLPVPQGALSSSASFSFTPNPQLVQNAQIQPSKSGKELRRGRTLNLAENLTYIGI